MRKSLKVLLISVGVLIVLIGVVGITYAYLMVGKTQDQANTFYTNGCLNISLTSNSNSINLDNIYPITDIEGLDTTSYDFTIQNTCNTNANYQINLESINEQANSLNADYIKVSLSSDTVGNVISTLSNNTSISPTISNAYEAYNLYTGTLTANETKTYHLKLWIDYDATKEQAASKTYSSKINVVANPEIDVVDTLEAQFSLKGKTVTTSLSNNVTSATYCISDSNICTPNISANISNNSYSIELEEKESKQIVCTKLNSTSKVICSEPLIAKALASDVILAGKTISSSRSSSITGVLTGNESNDSKTIYTTEDDWGTSYFFAGLPNNNWVSFAGHYWRIIRINGDGSIRMIYSGTGSAQTSGTSTQITVDGTNTFRYNPTYEDNTYVGFMTGLENECESTTSCSGSSRTTSYSQATSNTYDSNIKDVLNAWYQSNLASDADKISTEAGFCNDRKVYTGSSWSGYGTLGYGTNKTTYEPTSRFMQWSSGSSSWKSTQNPTLKCSQSNDLFTASSSSEGNKKLTNPIGLITSDEVVFAGGFGGTINSNYYLNTGQYYWTMSPYSFLGSGAHVFLVGSSGSLGSAWVHDAWGVRPVINLKADVRLTGDGTSSNPYVVSS